MKFLCSFLLIGLLPLVFAQQCTKKPEYDFYLLSLTWPSTFCSQNKCRPQLKSGETKFIVHGLWPNRKDRQSVGYCCNEDYRKAAAQLQPFKAKLAGYWPSTRDANVDGFWSYEWKKHGSCALDTPQLKGVKNYFETTLKLVEKLDMENLMKKIDFAPSDNMKDVKDSRKMESAITKELAKPKIRCIPINNQVAILEQISFCYDKSLKLIDCDGKLQCRPKIVIPTFKAMDNYSEKN